jgi:putative nucleotidyltransferase with HDIG domain
VALSQPKKEVKEKDSTRIVLAIPDEEWAEELSDAFQRAGFTPHRTPSAETAVLAAGYRTPLAVLLDGTLLETSGFQLLDALRLQGSGAPVLVITPAEASQLRLKAMLWGAEDCLTRPFDPQEAVLRVRRLLESRKAILRLEESRGEAEKRSESDRDDARSLREDLRRNAILLQRAVEFHRRLSLTGDRTAVEIQFLRHLSLETGVDRLAYLAARHSEASWLVTQASWGVPHRLAVQLRLPANGELAALLKTGGTPLVVDRLGSLPPLRLELGILAAGGFRACVPLMLKNDLFAVVLLGEGKSGGTPSSETLRLAHFLSSAMVPGLAAQESWDRERTVSAGTLGFLVASLEAKSPYLQGHSARVAGWAESLGLELGMGQDDLSALSASALLHDIGRFQTDLALWSKSDPLVADDWDRIRKHPVDGASILAEASWPGRVLAAVRHHHERWDGSGYPLGLRGQAIPWDARILAVADTLDALTSERPHRPALTPLDALQLLQRESGSQFDPTVVSAAERVLAARANAA